jgi:ER membrane protein complex subunit 4
MSSTLPTPEWVLRLQNPPKINKSKTPSVPDPPGFTPTTASKARSKTNTSSSSTKAPTPEETDTLKVKKAWELALGPAKQLPMNAIGMYMTGNSLQVFSIMMVFMLFKGPITAILGLNNAFQRFETEGTRDRLLLAKAVYVLTNCLVLALGVWKINQMGLLPTTRSDWLLWETARMPTETAVMG